MPEKFGRYDILMELGRGGMAELYLGRRSNIGGFEKLVAIKRILPHLAEDPQFRELFLNEARIAAQLSHPNVCQVYELEEAEGELFLAMEYLEGISWDTLIAAAPRGEIAMRLATAVIVQASEGLHYAHTLRDATGRPTPIVHRDVSPQNLFVTVDGVCKVLDFGIAKMAKEGPKTRTGVLKGKLPYMAPEQIKGEAVDGRTDLFALGVCLWEALTGERLYDRDTDFLIWKAISEEAVPSVNAKVQRYPAGLDGVIGRALAKDKEARYATVREFAEDLSRVVYPMSDAEIAGLARSLCADRLARRQREIAEVVSESRAASIELRAMTADVADAGSTTNLRGPDAEPEPDAGATVKERPSRLAAPPPVAPPMRPSSPEPSATVSMAMRGDSMVMPRPRRRWPVIAIAAIAAAMIVVVVILATRGPSAKSPVIEPAIDEAMDRADDSPETPVADKPDDLNDLVKGFSLGSNGISVDNGEFKVDIGSAGGLKIERKKPPKTPPSIGSAAKIAPVVPVAPIDAAPPIAIDAGVTPIDAAPMVAIPASDAAPAAPIAETPPPPAAPGTYSIDSSPYATIYVDGASIGDTPLNKVKLPAGKHTVKAVIKDGRTRQFPIEIKSGELYTSRLAWE